MDDPQIVTEPDSEWPPAIPTAEAPEPTIADVRQCKIGRTSVTFGILGIVAWISIIPMILMFSFASVRWFTPALGLLLLIGGFGLEVAAIVLGIKARSTGSAKFGLGIAIPALCAACVLLTPHVYDHVFGDPGGCGMSVGSDNDGKDN